MKNNGSAAACSSGRDGAYQDGGGGSASWADPTAALRDAAAPASSQVSMMRRYAREETEADTAKASARAVVAGGDAAGANVMGIRGIRSKGVARSMDGGSDSDGDGQPR